MSTEPGENCAILLWNYCIKGGKRTPGRADTYSKWIGSNGGISNTAPCKQVVLVPQIILYGWQFRICIASVLDLNLPINLLTTFCCPKDLNKQSKRDISTGTSVFSSNPSLRAQTTFALSLLVITLLSYKNSCLYNPQTWAQTCFKFKDLMTVPL